MIQRYPSSTLMVVISLINCWYSTVAYTMIYLCNNAMLSRLYCYYTMPCGSLHFCIMMFSLWSISTLPCCYIMLLHHYAMLFQENDQSISLSFSCFLGCVPCPKKWKTQIKALRWFPSAKSFIHTASYWLVSRNKFLSEFNKLWVFIPIKIKIIVLAKHNKTCSKGQHLCG